MERGLFLCSQTLNSSQKAGEMQKQVQKMLIDKFPTKALDWPNHSLSQPN